MLKRSIPRPIVTYILVSEVSALILTECYVGLVYPRIVLVVPKRILYHPMTNPFLRYIALCAIAIQSACDYLISVYVSLLRTAALGLLCDLS